ncbi:hypothetical protein D917_06635 [Trichinella nativa]|uniref:Reverse transcriptase domain-containing protein n=1 Tax=Trichinella nativa TaxID=6335 RepID=A0A1Y3EVF9_9BILA|nr:hypothetical protein D917_06635 [Trichinella nativa]
MSIVLLFTACTDVIIGQDILQLHSNLTVSFGGPKAPLTICEVCCPWRAQALVVTTDNHKKRMIIDYSQTINRFTLLDAYPLAKINDMVQAISNYRFFSTVDLKSAYYKIPINARDKPYIAFEADGRLYQFKRIPFGVTNGATCFQRVMDNILRVEKLKDTFVYVDNVTICGMNEEDHDKNLNRYREVAEKYNQTLIRTNVSSQRPR